MKAVTILASIVVLMSGCGRKAPVAASSPETETKKHPPAAGKAVPDPAIPPPSATKEQISAAVRVRVIAGGLPVRNVAGAILSRRETPNTNDFFDQHRCVLALLQNWTEDQLRNSSTKILIFRNLPDSQGRMRSFSYVGKLQQYDEQSGIAAIAYYQGFSSTTDVGYGINRSASESTQAVALRFQEGPPKVETLSSDPNTPSRKAYSAMPVDEGVFSASPDGSGELQFSAGRSPVDGDETFLIATTPTGLIGFASPAGPKAAKLVRITSTEH
jgi:hypothetical protein